jgi:hypothetical protein
MLGTHAKAIRARLPRFADGFEKLVADNLQRPFEAYLEKQEAIRVSGPYSPDGERAELRLAARAMREKLIAVKAATATNLETHLAEKRGAAL